jgi:4-amino-4-deoxy-L-arabinose transferase-like glycosyltransferase
VKARRSEILSLAALLLLGSLSFIHLTAIPAFEDEGTQLRWIWRAIEAGEWLEPLGDGKPLEAWPMVPLMWLGAPPLAGVRAVHVLMGMLGIVLTYRLALQLTQRNTAFVSAALFAICPFVVYLQRFALSDMLLCTAGIWVLVSEVQLIERPSWRRAGALAVALGVAALCKLPVGFILLVWMPLAVALMPAAQRQTLLRHPFKAQSLVAHAPAMLMALCVILVGGIRAAHGASPGFGLRDLFGVGLGQYEDIGAAIGVPRPDLLHELAAQLSWPTLALALIGWIAAALLGDWRQRWLIAAGAVPMLAIGVFAHFWYSRYLLFTLPPLIIAAVCGWQALALRLGRPGRPLTIAAMAIGLCFMGYQSALLILDPQAARWSALDRFQYFEGWGSGYGYPQAARFLLAAARPPAHIYALDGHSAYQLRAYVPPALRARIAPVFYGEDGRRLRSNAERLQNLLHHAPAWIIVPEQLRQRYLQSTFGDAALRELDLHRIAAFDKPGGHTQVTLYEATRR